MEFMRKRPHGLTALATAALIAGCGDTSVHVPAASNHAPAVSHRATATVHASPAPSGRPLVIFKEAIGADPTVSQLTVDTNGQAATVIVDGGIDGAHKHSFTMAPAQFRRVCMLLQHTRLADTRNGNPNHYTYWVLYGGHGWEMAQDYLPSSMRRLIVDLDALTNDNLKY